jgi:glycosyltransferase involved in cell wall biosynthesis
LHQSLLLANFSLLTAQLKFLFFLYYYPPVPGTAAKRNARISRAISEKAQSTHIFTASQIPGDQLQQRNPKVTTITAFDYRNVLRRNTRDGAVPENMKQHAAAQWMIRLINSFPFNIVAGEGGLIYFFNLLRRGSKAIRDEQITHLYSSYRPFADHYAAFLLKKKHPEIYWIADFRDLIIDPHYNHILFAGNHHTFFSKIFRKADLLTTVSDGLAVHLRAYNQHVITLRNGIEGDISLQPVLSSTFTIVYTGSMFLDKRNVDPLFLALQELLQDAVVDGSDISILYAGKDGHVWKQVAKKYRLESLLDDRGIVSAAEAIQLQLDACINVLLTVSSDQLQGVLTGKMIEYFQSGSPVLGIVVGQNDPELHSILSELEIGASYSDQPDDLEHIKSFILREYLHWKKTGMNRKPVNVDVLKRNYSIEAVMSPLWSVLDKTKSAI